MAEAFNTFLGENLRPGEEFDIDWSSRHPDSPEVPLGKAFVTVEEVKRAIQKANSSADAGPDGLHMAIFVEACDLIADLLAILYNQIFQSGVIPEAFREAKVKSLHKKKARDQMINYSPLSMANHIGKVWERLLSLMKHLEDNGLLSKKQHGFRPKRGAFSNMIELWEYIMEN